METLDKPYVTARKAAERLGVPETVVTEDLGHGTAGSLSALVGGEVSPGHWWVARWEVEGDRLEMHKARLAGKIGLCARPADMTDARMATIVTTAKRAGDDSKAGQP